MRQALVAGSTFGVSVGLGLLLGLALNARTHQSLWVVGGLFAGFGLGAFLAVRLLLAAGR